MFLCFLKFIQQAKKVELFLFSCTDTLKAKFSLLNIFLKKEKYVTWVWNLIFYNLHGLLFAETMDYNCTQKTERMGKRIL